MEKKESSDGEPSTMSPEVEAFFHLIDREWQRLQLLEERKSRSSGNQSANKTITWQFEVEDFRMYSAANVQSDLDKLCIGRSGHLEEKEEERLILGTKRTREFLYSAENVQSDLDKLCIGRSGHLEEMEEERLILGTKRTRESTTPLLLTSTKKKKKNKSKDASGGSGCGFDLNKVDE